MITLSVDDQQAVTELMLYMLGKIDPNGTHMSASNMKQALSLLSDDVQILFLDIEMPGKDGIEIGNAGGMSDEQAAYLYFFKD